MKTLAVAVVAGLAALCGAWDDTFKTIPCYAKGLDDLEDRMPQSVGNLIALVEKWESQHTYSSPEEVAEAIIRRYKKDGITFNPDELVPWGKNEHEDSDKDEVVYKVLSPTKDVPVDTYEPREECGLHFLTSHSTDIYPHAGTDDVWDNARRRRRSAPPLVNTRASYALPDGVNPARHPIENGVMYTPHGPVAAGTLLEGISAAGKTSEVTISAIYGNQEVEYMPNEMSAKRLNPQYISTLAGDIGQAALIAASKSTVASSRYLGPEGRFGNKTAAPKLFTLETVQDEIIAYLTRAEIFAGIDAMLMQQVLSSSSSSQLRLSHVLRMYYSEHGLPGFPQYRACNRMNAFSELNEGDVVKTKIYEQSLNFMYAYGHMFPSIHDLIEQSEFAVAESHMKDALDKQMSAFNTFVDNYGYEDFDQCPIYNTKDIKCESLVDLLVVYSHEGGTFEMEKQREYITHLAQMVGVGETRSRLGVLDGKKADWVTPMTNFTNVADWGSNFTTDETHSYGSGSDMNLVLEQLRKYYSTFYAELRGDPSNAEANAQVVLWNVPSGPPDNDVFRDEMRLFRLNYPDVYFVMVGKSKGNYNDILLDINKDFYVNNAQVQEDFAATLAERICQVPSVFVYPACDTHNRNFSNYREANHLYTGYVSPDYTTYIRIAPHNFLYSGYLKLSVSGGDVDVCTSREDMNVPDPAEYECLQDQGDLEWHNLCGRWLEECKPIYLSVKGHSDVTAYCNDERCQYPNQVKFEMRHEGMTCGSWCPGASVLLLCLAFAARLLH